MSRNVTPLWMVAALAAGALAACGTPVSGVGASSPPAGSDVLGAWAAFPVKASPRPVVLIGSAVIDPATGFATDADKIAYISGGLILSARLPASSATADGRQLIAAVDALSILRGASGAKPSGSSGLRIIHVDLRQASFTTDRGRRTLPAWAFTFRGVSDPAFVLALPQSVWWPKPGMPSSQVGDPASVSSDGQRVTVWFIGAAPGTGPCEVEYTAEVTESNTAVIVAQRQLPAPSPSPSVICAAVGYRRSVTAALTSPLGNRVLLTPDGAPVPTNQAPLLRP